jgi:hypothetical protein
MESLKITSMITDHAYRVCKREAIIKVKINFYFCIYKYVLQTFTESSTTTPVCEPYTGRQ